MVAKRWHRAEAVHLQATVGRTSTEHAAVAINRTPASGSRARWSPGPDARRHRLGHCRCRRHLRLAGARAISRASTRHRRAHSVNLTMVRFYHRLPAGRISSVASYGTSGQGGTAAVPVIRLWCRRRTRRSTAAARSRAA
jgi:hypothetical protein